MLSLARATLLHDWRRYLAAVLATAFSALLILVQFALLLGMFGTVTTVVDRARAALWITSPDLPSLDLGREIPRRLEPLARRHPAVASSEPLHYGLGEWRTPLGTKVTATVIGYDLRPGGLGLPLALASLAARLAEPQAVLIDEADQVKLGVRAGGVAELNGRRVRVVGLVQGFRAIGGVNVLASMETFRHLGLVPPSGGDSVSFLLLGLRPGEEAERTRDGLRNDLRGVSVWTARELSLRSRRYWLLESGAGAGAGFSSLLGLVVGVAITSQTLRGAILASLREFATLRALGVPARSLAGVVLEQSLWVGLAGLTLATLGLGGVALLGRALGVALEFPAWLFASTAVFSLAIALLSGLLALRPLYAAEPAELLR